MFHRETHPIQASFALRFQLLACNAVLCLAFLSSCNSKYPNRKGTNPIRLEDLLQIDYADSLLGGTGLVETTRLYSDSFPINVGDSMRLALDDGRLISVTRIRNQLRDGIYMEFHPNGKLYFVGSSKSNESDGIFREYDEGGSLIEIAFLVGGKEVGQFKGGQLDSLLKIIEADRGPR